jgi:hypothetical protein
VRPHPLATALSTLGLAALGLTALPADLGAIPAFARK